MFSFALYPNPHHVPQVTDPAEATAIASFFVFGNGLGCT